MLSFIFKHTEFAIFVSCFFFLNFIFFRWGYNFGREAHRMDDREWGERGRKGVDNHLDWFVIRDGVWSFEGMK